MAVIYYSGHGLQDNDTNYLVPIGAESDDATKRGKLVALQDLIERITDYSTRRLVILDACRSNPAAKKLATDLQRSKGLEIDGEVVTADGLAKTKTPANTFLAFAAAPGSVAYNGVGRFSPFTDALLKHIHAVDLPLYNLTLRVRLDVLKATEKLQETWDTSSLTAPFFFNPSSLLLLVGNTLGLVALISSLAPYSFLLKEDASIEWGLIGAAVLALVMGLFLSGLHNAYARLRGDNDGDPGDGRRRLREDAKKGFIGGVFGGMIAAFVIATTYWHASVETGTLPPFGQLLTESTVAGIFVAATLGVLSLVASTWLSTRASPLLSKITSRNRTLIGAVVGGIAAGLVAGPFVTLYFARFFRPVLQPMILAPGAILGTAVIAFAIVNYSLESFSLKRLARSAVGALAATFTSLLVAGIFLGLLYWTGFVKFMVSFVADKYFYGLLHSWDGGALSLLFGGLIYGLVIGPILGLLIGLALIWTPESEYDLV